jgi:hypothetical protein
MTIVISRSPLGAGIDLPGIPAERERNMTEYYTSDGGDCGMCGKPFTEPGDPNGHDAVACIDCGMLMGERCADRTGCDCLCTPCADKYYQRTS